MSRRIETSALAREICTSPFRIILGLGFDPRGMKVLDTVLPSKPSEVIALMNVGWSTQNLPAVQAFQKKLGNKGVLIGENCNNILQLADALAARLSSFDLSIKTIVDITSMSHELLSMLVAVLHLRNQLEGIILCYTGAEKYSFNTSESDMWLSRGVHSIRSVLGYPGELLPSKKLHLVIAMGFEVERAIEVIASYEPAVISLGVGRREHSVSDAHYNANIVFFNKLEAFLSEQERSFEHVSKFSFSCVDPFETKLDFTNHLSSFPNFNTVICPLNTKISTVGISLVCLEQPPIQLCYSQPIEYNVDGYATASDWITVIKM